MDSRSKTDIEAEVQRHIAEIKAHMPETYKSILVKADEIGRQAFVIVRAGLRGEPNRFWSMERGWVKGTPFNTLGIQEETAVQMVRFGCAHACIFGVPASEAQDGAN